MITVICTYLNPANFMPISNLEKIFFNQDDFIKFYRLAKTDPCVVLNVKYFNTDEKKALQDVYDMLLLKVSRENPL